MPWKITDADGKIIAGERDRDIRGHSFDACNCFAYDSKGDKIIGQLDRDDAKGIGVL